MFEVFKKNLNANPNIIVNLQGDMPNISPETINNLVDYMNKGHCEIGTLASKLSSNEELEDENVVKVLVKENLKTYLRRFRPITDAINIKNGYIINIGIDYKIITKSNFVPFVKKIFDKKKSP